MNVVRVLEHLAAGPRSVPELARITGVSLPTVRRITRRLRTENYVVQHGGRHKRYRATIRFAAIGLEAVRRTPLPRLTQPLLAELARATEGRPHLWIAGPGEPIDLARPVMVDDGTAALPPAPAGSVLDPMRDHLRSVALVRHAGDWIVIAAVMDHGRVAAAVGLSGCEDVTVTCAVVAAADRLGAELCTATADV